MLRAARASFPLSSGAGLRPGHAPTAGPHLAFSGDASGSEWYGGGAVAGALLGGYRKIVKREVIPFAKSLVELNGTSSMLVCLQV